MVKPIDRYLTYNREAGKIRDPFLFKYLFIKNLFFWGGGGILRLISCKVKKVQSIDEMIFLGPFCIGNGWIIRPSSAEGNEVTYMKEPATGRKETKPDILYQVFQHKLIPHHFRSVRLCENGSYSNP